jgi:hypothetical protein
VAAFSPPSLANALLERLNRLPFELHARSLKIEFQREAKAAAAKFEMESAVQEEENVNQRYSSVIRFCTLLNAAKTSSCELYAFMAGPALKRDWESLSDDHRSVLSIDQIMRSHGNAVLNTGANMRARLASVTLILAAILQLIWGKNHIYAPILLIAYLVCYLFPIGQWQETVRKLVFPQKIVKLWIMEQYSNREFSRFFSIFYCCYALVLCLATRKHLLDSTGGYPNELIFFVSVLLFASWLTAPESDSTLLEISPPIFVLCVISSWTLGANGLLILSVSAFWKASVYAAQKAPWHLIVGTIWILASISAFFYWGRIPIAAISFGVPWLLYELSRKQSVAFVLTLMSVAAIFMPFSDGAMLMVWIGVVALVSLSISLGMWRWSEYFINQATRTTSAL